MPIFCLGAAASVGPAKPDDDGDVATDGRDFLFFEFYFVRFRCYSTPRGTSVVIRYD